MLSSNTDALTNSTEVEIFMKSKKSNFASILTFVLVALIWLLPLSANAGGLYDGVWGVDDNAFTYLTFNQSGDQMIGVVLYADTGSWNAISGPVLGSQAELSLVVATNGVTAGIYLIEFTSDTTARATLTSCSPLTTCALTLPPVNLSFQLTKVF